jgi:hypothetical protein
MGISSLEGRGVIDGEKRGLLGELIPADLVGIIGLMFVTTIETKP